MRLKLIACEVFFREAVHFAGRTQNIVDAEFLEKGLHERSDQLRAKLQERIDAAKKTEKYPYEAVLLAYGLCGNSAEGLKAGELPVVIARVHDCAGFLLGSNKRFLQYFKDNLSRPFTSAGYMERGDSMYREGENMKLYGTRGTYEEFVKMYGEENAKFIMESLSPKKHNDTIVYIETEMTKHLGFDQKTKEYAEKEKLKYLEYKADLGLMQDLINGEWEDKERFLVVKPGETIKACYDDLVIKAV